VSHRSRNLLHARTTSWAPPPWDCHTQVAHTRT
jgi:hypothetical protein